MKENSTVDRTLTIESLTCFTAFSSDLSDRFYTNVTLFALFNVH